MGQTRIDTSHIVVQWVCIDEMKKKYHRLLLLLFQTLCSQFFFYYYYYDYRNNFYVILSTHIYILHTLTSPDLTDNWRQIQGWRLFENLSKWEGGQKTVPVNTKTTKGNRIKVPSTSQRVMGYSYTKPPGIRQKNDFTLRTKTFIGLLSR